MKHVMTDRRNVNQSCSQQVERGLKNFDCVNWPLFGVFNKLVEWMTQWLSNNTHITQSEAYNDVTNRK